MLTGRAALGVNAVLANTESDATEKMNEQYELTPTGRPVASQRWITYRVFAVCLDLEMSMYCKWMSTNVRFVRVSSKRCKHAFGNHKPERCEGCNHIPRG